MVGDRYMLVAGGWGANENAESAKEEEEATAIAAGAQASRSMASSAAASAAAGPRRSRGLWLLDTVEGEWTQPEAVGRHPGLRYGQCMAVLGPYALLFGGWDGVKSRADIAQLDLSSIVGDGAADEDPDAATAAAAGGDGMHAEQPRAVDADGGSNADSMAAGLSVAGSGRGYDMGVGTHA
jgi:hypothetical protein